MRFHRDSAGWASLFGLIGIGVTAAGQLALAPIMKGQLGTGGLGVWMLLLQSFNLCLLAELGLSDGMVKLLAEGRDTPGRPMLVASARVLSWLAGAAVCLASAATSAGLLLLGSIPPERMAESIAMAAVLAAWGLLRFPLRLSLKIAYADGTVATYGLYEMAIGALRPLLAIAVILWIWPTCMGALAGFIAGEVLPLLVAHACHRQAAAASAADPGTMRRMWRLGLGTSVWSLSTVAIPYLIVLLLGFSSPPETIAAFQCSILAGSMVVRVALIPANAWFPSWVAWRMAGHGELWPPATARIVPWGIAGLTCALTGLIALNRAFVARWVGAELYAGDAVNILWSVTCVGWAVMGVLIQLHRVWFDRLGHLVFPLCLPVGSVLIAAGTIRSAWMVTDPILPLTTATCAGVILSVSILTLQLRSRALSGPPPLPPALP